MIIIGCSGGKHLAGKIAKKLKCPYSLLKVKKYPDGELNLRLMSNVKGKEVVLVQSFYGDVNECLVEAIFAAETANELGAKKVILVAPYLAYLRKDIRYGPGECINRNAITNIISRYFDRVLVIDPHIRKGVKISSLFSIKAVEINADKLIADYIKKNIKNPLVVGPDKGSLNMAKGISNMAKCNYAIFEKTRISGWEVKTKARKKVDLKGRNIIFVDDIISTGNTILECVKNMKKMGAKRFYCVVVHGIFIENALEKLRKANVKVVTTNTIPNKVSKIDISGLIAERI